jgi:hypothetical protein
VRTASSRCSSATWDVTVRSGPTRTSSPGIEEPPARVFVQQLARHGDGGVLGEVIGVHPKLAALVAKGLPKTAADRPLEHEEPMRLRIAEGPQLALGGERCVFSRVGEAG